MSSWAVIVPTNRPDRYREFERAWAPLFVEHDVQVYSIFDGPRAEAPATACAAWEDIPHFVPRRTDMIRSWGIYLAWREGHDYTLSLDDDVLPGASYDDGWDIFGEYEWSFQHGGTVSDYFHVGSLTTGGLPMRGLPFGARERRPVAVQYGGWNGVLDYPADLQIQLEENGQDVASGMFAAPVVPVPYGAACTCCAMNMAWQTQYAPMMWQLPLYEGRYNRWGDIWSGLLQKTICDHARLAMLINGMASVRHERASDPRRNLELELPGVRLNEHLWAALDITLPDADDLSTVYEVAAKALIGHVGATDPGYKQAALRALGEWLELFA